MKRNIRKLLLFACITSMTSFGAQAIAQSAPEPDQAQQTDRHPRKHQRGAKKNHVERLAKELGLSEQQKGKIQEIFKTSHAQNEALFKNLKTARRQLQTLVLNGADEAAIRAESAKVATLQADLAVARARCAKQVQALLTPEQVAKLKVHMQERERRWDKAPGHRHFLDESAPGE